MRLGPVLKGGAVIVAALAVALIAVSKSLDTNRYKAFVADQVKAATGRTLTIDGALELKLGLVPRLVARQVFLSNAAGAAHPLMVAIEEVEAEVALLPLLRHQVDIRRLIISSPEIWLETDAKGRGNWLFDAKAPAAPASEDTPPTRLNLQEVKIKNARVVWKDMRNGREETVNVHKIQVLPVGPQKSRGGGLDLKFIADTRGRLIELAGHGGDLAAVAPGKPWPIQLKGTIAGLTATVDGTVADVLGGRGIDLKINLQDDEIGKTLAWAGLLPPNSPPLGPLKLAARLSDAGGIWGVSDLEAAVGKRDAVLVSAKGRVVDAITLAGVDLAAIVESDDLAGASTLAGTALPSMGPIRVSATVKGGKANWQVSDIKAVLGRGDAGHSDLGGDIALVLSAPRPQVSGTLTSQSLSSGDFATPAVKPGTTLPPRVAKPDEHGRLFPASPLPVAALSVLDVDLQVTVARLNLDGLVLGDVVTHVGLKNGKMDVKPFSARLGGGSLAGEAMFDGHARVPAVIVRMQLDGADLGAVVKSAGGAAGVKGGVLAARIDLRGQGDSPRAVMASLGGSAQVTVNNAVLDNRSLDWLGGDLPTQVVTSLNPLGASDTGTALQCAVARFTIKTGLASANRGLAVETDATTMAGGGSVDLRDERLDLVMQPRARQGVGLSVAPTTRVQGTLAHPRIGLDEEGTARTAASAAAAVATGGISLLGEMVFDRMTADDHPCQTALGKSGATKSATGKSDKTHKSKSGTLLERLIGR